MKLSSKYFRVIFKLYLRSLKRTPHTAAVTAMALITLSLTSFISYDAYINHGRFSQSTFSKWNNFQKKLTGRNIAGAQTAQCEYNNVNLVNLKQEIKMIESQFETGHFIEGNWYGVNLRSIPSIQAQFLADFGDYIGDKNQSQNYTNCNDVVCILSTLYNGDEEAGYLAYYWYLKTGSMISMSNKIPGQKSDLPGTYSDRKHLTKDYLFTKDELRNFFVLAKSLPEKFLHNPLLKSIHKVPNNSKLENYAKGECTISTSNGHILINQDCLGHNNDLQKFLLTISTQMAKYIDLYEGRKNSYASISSSTDWLDKSLWVKDEFFDINRSKYQNKWLSHLQGNQFVSKKAKTHPALQLAELMSHYRFKPGVFRNNTPADLQRYIKTSFFNGQNFDGNGLYKQYIKTAVNEWSKNEVNLWSDCFDKYLNEDEMGDSPRDLASQVDNPLFTCVEKKVPTFITNVVAKIKNENFEGCQFFSDTEKFGHLSNQFHSVLDKYLQEKVLKRKIEFQNHGMEVLLGQEIKQEFITSVDPSSIFINCYGNDHKEDCYNAKMTSEVTKLLNQNHRELSEYYKKIIKGDVLQLFPYNVTARNTNKIAKKYITPFYSKINFAAKYLWDSCKEDESFSTTQKINLPMKFTGGIHFVNAKLLNCINAKIEDELYEIVSLGAFHEQDEEMVEFKLNTNEKGFALSFMEGKLVQILNNILEEEVSFEKKKLAQHFSKANGKIATNLTQDKDFFDDVYSYIQVKDKCLERVTDYYPESYYYKSTAQIDSGYGRKICSTIIATPEIKKSLTTKVEVRWNENKALAEEFLDEYFEDFVDDCNDDYPVTRGRGSMRNSRMRKICIEESYELALNDGMEEWKEDDNYEYFANKEQQIVNHLFGLKKSKVQNAISPIKKK